MFTAPNELALPTFSISTNQTPALVGGFDDVTVASLRQIRTQLVELDIRGCPGGDFREFQLFDPLTLLAFVRALALACTVWSICNNDFPIGQSVCPTCTRYRICTGVNAVRQCLDR